MHSLRRQQIQLLDLFFNVQKQQIAKMKEVGIDTYQVQELKQLLLPAQFLAP